MAEEEERERKKKRGGLGEFLKNREALYALGSGFSAASRGGDFSAGLGRGLADWGAIQDRRSAREMAHLEAQGAAQQKERMAAFRQGLDPEQQGLFDIAPNEVVKSQIAGKDPRDEAYQYYRSQGDDPGTALKKVTGKSLEETLADYIAASTGMKPLDIKESEANKGLKATAALTAHEALNKLESPLFAGQEGAFNPSDFGNSALTFARETPLVGRFAEIITPQDMRLYNLQIDRFMDAWAREMTGAAMPDSERPVYRNMLGARPNDPVAVLRVKAENRQIMAESLREAAGSGQEIYERVLSRMTDPYTGGDAKEGGLAPANERQQADDIDALVEQYRTK